MWKYIFLTQKPMVTQEEQGPSIAMTMWQAFSGRYCTAPSVLDRHSHQPFNGRPRAFMGLIMIPLLLGPRVGYGGHEPGFIG